MKIKSIKTRIVKNPLPRAELGGLSWHVDLASTIVEITAEDGTVGIGETTMSRGPDEEDVLARAVISLYAPMLEGADLTDIEAISHRMWLYGRTVGFISPMSGIDQALWDLKGKVLGVPVSHLLGGPVRDKVNAYACSALKKSVDEHVEDVKYYVELGFKATKLSIGRGIEEDIELIERTTEAGGGKIQIAVDANGFYQNTMDAVPIAEACDANDIFWLEEPLPVTNVDGLAYLNEKFRTPISGYQSETTAYRMTEYLAKNALDIYQPRLDYCGGISHSKKVSVLCDIHHKRFIPHAFGSGVKFAGTLQVIASAVSGGWIEFPVLKHDKGPRTYHAAAYLKDPAIFNVDEQGMVSIPTKPGTGAELDADAVRELQRGEYELSF